MPPCSRKISRRGQDDAILEKRFVLVGFGGLRKIAKSTKPINAWSGNMEGEPHEQTIHGLKHPFRNADGTRRTIQTKLIKNIKINVR